MPSIATSNAATKQEIRDVGSMSVFSVLTVNSATPTIGTLGTFKTANTIATTYTNFVGGYDGQRITIVINDAFTTFDFTASSLVGNSGVDWIPNSGDSLTAVFDGTSWYCQVRASSSYVFNVADFGAFDDGLTDYLTEIELANTTAEAAGGGTLYLPFTDTGKYVISDGFILGENVTLTMGDGVILENQYDVAGTDKYTIKMGYKSTIANAHIEHLFGASNWTGTEILVDGYALNADGTEYMPFDRSSRNGIHDVTVRSSANGTGGHGNGITLKVTRPGSIIQWLNIDNVKFYQVKYGLALEQSGFIDSQAFATTDVNTTTNVITLTAHGLNTNDTMRITSTGTLPGGIVLNRDLYAVVLTSDTIQVKETVTGSVVNLSTQGTGTHTSVPRPVYINGNQFSNLYFDLFVRGISDTIADASGGNNYNNLMFQAKEKSTEALYIETTSTPYTNVRIWDWQLAVTDATAISFQGASANNYVETASAGLDFSNVDGNIADNNVNFTKAGIGGVRSYTVASLAPAMPAANYPGMMVYCTDGGDSRPTMAYSDGAAWLRTNGGALSSAYKALAIRNDLVTWNTTRITRSTPFTGSDSSVGTCSFWFKVDPSATDTLGYILHFGTNNAFRIVRTATTGTLGVVANNATGTIIANGETTTGFLAADSAWHHCHIIWDYTGTGSMIVSIDGVAETMAWTVDPATITADVIGFTSWGIGGVGITCTKSGTVDFGGCLSDFFLDQTTSHPIASFIGVDGRPADISALGTPEALFNNPAGSYNINKGSGGNLTIWTDIYDCSTSPSD